MKLSEQQAAAILDLYNKWQAFKVLIEEKDINLHYTFDNTQKAITQDGIELLRKYHVAAMNLLPNGIPEEGEEARKEQFIKHVIQQMMFLHQSNALVKMEQNASKKIRRQMLTNTLDHIATQTPIAQLFVHTLNKRTDQMKTIADLRTMVCILIAKYSLQKLLLKHYEQKDNRDYYQQEPHYQEQLQTDFKNLVTQLLILAD
ncbi:MAG: hypothetical protein ACRBFS_10355 [Aureispira sp.]